MFCVLTLFKSIVKFAKPSEVIPPPNVSKVCTSSVWIFFVVVKFKYDPAAFNFQPELGMLEGGTKELELDEELGADEELGFDEELGVDEELGANEELEVDEELGFDEELGATEELEVDEELGFDEELGADVESHCGVTLNQLRFQPLCFIAMPKRISPAGRVTVWLTVFHVCQPPVAVKLSVPKAADPPALSSTSWPPAD